MRQKLCVRFGALVAVTMVLAVWSATAQTRDRQLTLSSGGHAAGGRIALVIGNSAYESSPLKNPANDARDVATALRGLGFDVALGVDWTKREMEDAIYAFGQKLKGGGVGLFYYAGHGMQVGGRNYLIPIGCRVEDERDVEFEAVDAARVLGKMDAAGNGLNLMILDACRNNPFARSFRSQTLGLAQMDAPKGSYIAYATAPGSVASDGTGRNGIYTEALLKAMRKPGLKVEEVFKLVRVEVSKATEGKQLPWDASSLVGDFYFDQSATGGSDAQPGDRETNNANTEEDDVWRAIEDSREAADFEQYLGEYPSGRYAAEARAKLRRLRPKPTPGSAPVRVEPGALNDNVVKRIQPPYPPIAAASRIEGAVVVEVTVDESGNVVDAKALTGHALLTDAAVRAAQLWEFSPFKVDGQPVKVVGTLTFTFRK